MPKDVYSRNQSSTSEFFGWNEFRFIHLGIASAAVLGGLGMLFRRYRATKPYQYLVRTGLGIKDFSITKNGFCWPGQRAIYLNMSPFVDGFNCKFADMDVRIWLRPMSWPAGSEDNPETLKPYVNFLMGREDIYQSPLESRNLVY